MSTSWRSSRRQAKESRGAATIGGVAAPVSVIHAGSSRRPPSGSSTTKWASPA
ncbi:hypothetical protein [Mesorhizobium sp.]|uniref:hypothetical protein n=1 Tax=Mesorhizobium sp. TaxID=1871066 RepID=UPI00257B40E5|nr:hypothetical protein [Mesorhizobium sp.]